jgi:hypothetical protein
MHHRACLRVQARDLDTSQHQDMLPPLHAERLVDVGQKRFRREWLGHGAHLLYPVRIGFDGQSLTCVSITLAHCAGKCSTKGVQSSLSHAGNVINAAKMRKPQT